jgi:ubiquinone/menaquinone biosynthesis C-methylase UbiE
MSTSKRNKSKEVAATKQYYEKFADLWAKAKTDSFYHEKQFRKLLPYLPKNGSVIDIGCAWGIHAPLFLGIGRHLKYTGLDISRTFLKIARSRYPQLSFIEGDISNGETLPKERFDGFLASAVLMHSPNIEEAFANLEQITKQHSVGYISLPVDRPGEKIDTDTRHFTILNEKEQITLIQKRKWKILHRGTIDGFRKNGIWNWYIVRLP